MSFGSPSVRSLEGCGDAGEACRVPERRTLSVHVSAWEVWKLAVAGTLGVLSALGGSLMVGELISATLKWVGLE